MPRKRNDRQHRAGPCKVVSTFDPVVLSPEQQRLNERFRTFAIEQQKIRRDLWYATHPRSRRRPQIQQAGPL